MEELIMEIGEGEEGYLWTAGEITVDGETPEDAEVEDEDYETIYSIEDGDFDFHGNQDFQDGCELYESQIKCSKVCVIESVQNKRHIAYLDINGTFDPAKLKYNNGWIEYDSESFSTDTSEGNTIERTLYVDGEIPGTLPPLSYIVEVQDGSLTIGNEYLEMMGIEDGTRYELKLGRRAIRLVPEGSED